MPYDIYKCSKSNNYFAYGRCTKALWALVGSPGRLLAERATYKYNQLTPGIRPDTLSDLHGRIFEKVAGPYPTSPEIPACYFGQVDEPTQDLAYDGNPKDIMGRKKAPLHLIPATAQVHLSRAFADGVQKYGQANWREKGVNASVYIAAAQRHLALWYDGGEELASDSGVHHLGHAMACLAIILDAQQSNKLNDDRPSPVVGLADLFMNPEYK